MSFTVRPDALRRVGKDMRTLAESVSHARRYVDSYLRLEGHNGTVLATIGEHVNSIRGYLLTDYGPAGDALWAYEGFGHAMDGLARDYETTDGAQAAKYDRLMAEVDLNSVEAPKTFQAPTISLGDLTQRFSAAPEEGFPGLDPYNAAAQKVDYIVGFKWLGQFFSASGIVDPFQVFKKELEGDWKQVGRAVGALQAVSEYWSDVAFATRAMPNNFDGTWHGGTFRHEQVAGGYPSWSGNAADAATRHLVDLAGTAESHHSTLEDRATTVTAQMFYVNDLLDQLMGVIEDMLAIMPDGSNVEDYVKDVLSLNRAGERLFRMIKLVAKFLTTFRLLMDAVAVIVGAVSLLASLGSPDFPQVTYAMPDVDGP